MIKVDMGEGKIVEVDEKELPGLLGLKDKVTQLETQNKSSADLLTKAEKEKTDLEVLFNDDEGLKRFLQLRGVKTEGSSDEEKKGVNLDDLSPSQLAQHIQKLYVDHVEKLKSEFTKALEDLDTRVGTGFARMDVAMTANKYDDFETLKEKVFKIAGENPSWNAKKCYLEVKKVMKEEADVKATAEKEQKELEHKAFSESGSVPSSVLQDKALTGKAAAEKAYELVIGKEEK